MNTRTILSTMACGIALAAAPAEASLLTCSVPALSGLAIPAVTVLSATPVAASALDPAYCDVVGSVETHGEGADPGRARFRAKLPETWNRKYLASGPGGVGGNLDPSMNALDLALSLRKGYAFVTTDAGHEGVPTDASWALVAAGVPNEPALADYYRRAVHHVTVATKRLVLAYYGAGSIAYAYFDGCSNGGRHALVEAGRYASDYDGVIAGAPIIDRRGTNTANYKNAKAFLNAFIPPPALAAVNAAVVGQCDAIDGVADGLIQNPARCAFDPTTLVPQTLTQAQADALTVYLEGVHDDGGRLLFPGSSVSDLNAAGGFMPWAETIPPPAPASAQPWGAAAPLSWRLADSTVRYFVMRDSNFNTNLDWPELDGVLPRETSRLFEQMTKRGDADHPEELARFFKAGHKVLLYHGYSDPGVSPYRTVSFYQELVGLMSGYRQAQEHARLFMVPGMLHCGGGPGPNSFDTLSALEAWVERGIAPNAILATKYRNDNPALGVVRTMPLCAFPEQARYQGGDPNDAASWSCRSRPAVLY